MGFTTGFTGGVTLTLGLAYLTVLTHERNRRAQADALRSQSRVLNGLFEPAPLPPPQSRAELVREERSSLIETSKDRWNDEIENAVRWVQRKDWNEVREGMEGAVSRLLGGGLQKSREGIEEAEKQAAPRIQEAIDRSKATAKDVRHQAAIGVDRAAAATISGVERAGAAAVDRTNHVISSAGSKADELSASAKQRLDHTGVKAAEARDSVKAKADQATQDARAGAHNAADAMKNAGGTVDAAREALRGVVSKGIEKGKEVVANVQSAVGLASEKMESTIQSGVPTSSSPVEKALQERYQKSSTLDRTVEQVLEERYRPIESRDNTRLRGV